MTLAGEYFLLKEVVDNSKNHVQKIYISFHPNMLKINFLHNHRASDPSDRYFMDVFYQRYQEEITDACPEYTYDFPYFRLRKFYLLTLLDKIRGTYQYDNIEKPKYSSLIQAKKIITRRIAKIQSSTQKSSAPNEIKKLSDSFNFQTDSISHDNSIFLHKIYTYSKYKNIQLVFILEPLPISFYEKFRKSKMYRQLNTLTQKYPNTSFYDANRYFIFEDKFFKDGYHLNHKYGPFYENIFYNYFLLQPNK